MKPQVAIDVRMAHHTGIGRYIRGLVSALHLLSPHGQYLLIGNKAARQAFAIHTSYIHTDVPVYSLTEQAVLPWLVRSCGCLHAPHYNAPLVGVARLVVTIHDLIHLRFPSHLTSPMARLYASTVLPLVVKKAMTLIAVSEHTKRDLVEMLGVNPEKVIVIHHGLNPEFLSHEENLGRRDVFSQPYFLYVGLLKAHKNVGVLLKAFQQIKKRTQFSQLKLRLVGRPDVRQNIVRKWLGHIRHDADISLVWNIGDDQLKELYRNAIALVFPSLYEGFGLPIIEAMGLKTPVIAARSTSIPEILGEEAGLYFDPNSVSELVNAMEQLLSHDTLRSKLVQQGSQRVLQFNWAVAAEKTNRVYETVLGSC